MIKKIITILALINYSSSWAIDINIKNTNNHDVVQLVSELTGTTFVYFGAKNNGKISMIGKDLGDKKLIVFLHEVLGGINLGLIKGDGYFKVVNRYKSAKHNPPLIDSINNGIGIVNYIMPIEKIIASDIIKAVTPLIGDGGKISYQPETSSLLLSDDNENIRKIIKIINKISANIKKKQTSRVLVNYGDIDTIVAKISGLKMKDVAVIGDKINRQIFLHGDLKSIEKLSRIIKDMDLVKNKIIIEVLIAEISETKNKNTGVQMGLGSEYGIGFSGWGGSEITPIGSLLNSLSTGDIPSIPEGGSFGIGSDKGSKFKFGMLVQAIKKGGSSNILSTPLINTIDGVEAEFIVGKNVPFVTGVETGENPFQSIKREDVGLKLKVRPEILHNGEIKLIVEQEISSISGSTKLDDIITDKRFLKTEIMADDGDLIILGGLMDRSGGDSSKKIPLLGDIPYIGNLFKYEEDSSEKRKLLIFMKPKIITSKNKKSLIKKAIFKQNSEYNQNEKDSLIGSFFDEKE